MRHLTDKTEIATTINYRKMPVVHIDLADADEYGLVSKPVLIDDGRSVHLIKSSIRAYSDETKFKFSGEIISLHSDFGYGDIAELLDYANAPIVHADEDVLICVTDTKNKKAVLPFVLHTAKRVDSFCDTPLTFIDDDYDTKAFLALAGIEQEIRA